MGPREQHTRPNHLCMLGICIIIANTVERCSLFLPLQWGVGPMVLMLWLEWVT
jgi:hypothetical protein